jgi:hypothetical protein
VTGTFFRMATQCPSSAPSGCCSDATTIARWRQRGLAGLAGVFLAIDVVVWSAAIDQIGAGLGTLIVNSQVVLVPFVTWALFGERPGRRAVLAMPVVMAGLAAITGLGGADTFGDRPVLGVLLGAIAALFYTAFLVTFRRAGRTGPASGPLLDATIGAAITVAAYGFATGTIDTAITWPSHGWLVALALGIPGAGMAPDRIRPPPPTGNGHLVRGAVAADRHAGVGTAHLRRATRGHPARRGGGRARRDHRRHMETVTDTNPIPAVMAGPITAGIASSM